jgi:DNA-binding NarL/FixJ family response regulator
VERLQLKARVAVVDDHKGMLQHMVQLLQEEFEIVATGHSGEHALQAVHQFNPDILIIDIAMSPMNGLEVSQQLRNRGTRTAVILVTGYDDHEIRQQALSAGAEAFINKSRLHEDLLSAARKIQRRISGGEGRQNQKQYRKSSEG